MRQAFTQEMKNLMETFQQNIHTVLPGEIVAFDADKQEAQVKPTAKFWKPDSTKMGYPDIFEVPVFFIQGIGQKATITHVVKPGDECMLFIFEQALDHWRTKAESETDLRFDISNAVALTGFFAEPNPLVKRACDNGSIIIQRENTFIELFDKKIEIYTDGDIYGEADLSINMEAGIDINVEAGANINIEAGANISAEAGADVTIEAAADIKETASVNIKIEAGANIDIKAGADMTFEAGGDITMKAQNINLDS